VFDADFERSATTSLRFSELVLTPDNAPGRIADLMDGATSRLLVENQSINDETVISKLIAAKRRGVDVQVLLGFQPGFGGAPPANQSTLDELEAGGIAVRYLRRHYLHAKGIVADQAVYLGSQNFTHGGLGANRELGEILSDAAVVKRVAEIFADDWAHAGD
jgi:cardiolipin synthase A/B